MSTIKRNINTSLSSGITPARRRSLTRSGFSITATPATPINPNFDTSLVLTPNRQDYATEQQQPIASIKENAFNALLVSALHAAYSQADDPWPLPAIEHTRISKYRSEFGALVWDAWIQSLVQALNAHMATSQARDSFRRQISGDQRFTGGLLAAPKALQDALLQEWQRHSERMYYAFLRATAPTAPTALPEPFFPSTPVAAPVASALNISPSSPEIPLQTYARTPRSSVSRARALSDAPPAITASSTSSSSSSSAVVPVEEAQQELAPAVALAAPETLVQSLPPATAQYHISQLPHKHKITIFGHLPSQRTAAVALAAAGAPLAKVEHKANWSILTFMEPTHAAALLARAEHLQLGDTVLGAVPYNAAHEDDVPVRPTVAPPVPASVSAKSLNGTQRQVYAVRVAENRSWFEQLLGKFF